MIGPYTEARLLFSALSPEHVLGKVEFFQGCCQKISPSDVSGLLDLAARPRPVVRILHV